MSALIFVALAIAWASYLLPKAWGHHVDGDESGPIGTFSSRIRVLARREAINRREARLVIDDQRAAADRVRRPVGPARAGARSAARRRRRVLSMILIACVVVFGLAFYGTVEPSYAAIPATLLVSWLVACRLMVKAEASHKHAETSHMRVEKSQEHAETSQMRAESAVAREGDPAADADTRVVPRVEMETSADPGLWDPVPVTLPTYVSKSPAARRTIRSIDLDSTGVWTSGRSELDSRLAQEAEAEAEINANRVGGSDEHQAVGS
ncbi:MAG: divisome protein SepX/GlpR [Nocardioides sp.]